MAAAAEESVVPFAATDEELHVSETLFVSFLPLETTAVILCGAETEESVVGAARNGETHMTETLFVSNYSVLPRGKLSASQNNNPDLKTTAVILCSAGSLLLHERPGTRIFM